MAQVRVTRLARELPLVPDATLLLRTLAAGHEGAEAPSELVAQLKIRGLVQILDLRPAITELGHTYLAATDDVRTDTNVCVIDVDRRARTVQVEVPAWRDGELATVLLDQVVGDSGLDAVMLSGRWLVAEANLSALDHDRLVLTGFRSAAPLPAGGVAVDGGEAR
ncbi:hypothetical protein [Streptomyces sp. NPDC092952]|uniref:hypothetical protein n=1 Tax=Streptomyces sp. NPDC092952 TaxID=3366018 RepID=UPI0038001718